MPASAPRKDPRHRRTNLRPSRVGGRSRARQPIIAVLLGVVGFSLLVAYSAVGAGGAVANAADPADTQTISVKQASITDHAGDCKGTAKVGALFIITQLPEADAPDTIKVFFDPASAGSADSDQGVNPGASDTEQYSITFPAGVTGVLDATAEVPTDWTSPPGEFVLSHYVCGPAPSPTAPPSSSSAPVESSSSPVESSSAPILSSSAPAQGTSPFVPGPGETGDTAPASTPILKQGLLAGGLASLVAALGMSLQMLKRRGEHS